MKKYVATDTVETERRHYLEVTEKFSSDDDASAFSLAQSRIPTISSLYKEAPTNLRTLVETRKVNLKGLANKVG